MKNPRFLAGIAAAALLAASLGVAPAVANEDVYDWTGFYLGVFAGYGGANYTGIFEGFSSTVCSNDSCARAENLALNGLTGGFYAGYNWQLENAGTSDYQMVLGIEGDISLMNWNDTELADAISASNPFGTTDGISGRVDLLASVRARAGIAFDNVLLFTSAGLAFSNASYSVFDSGTTGTVQLNSVGAAISAGVEVAIDENVSFRAEGIMYIFNDRRSAGGLMHASHTNDFVSFDNSFVARAGFGVMLN